MQLCHHIGQHMPILDMSPETGTSRVLVKKSELGMTFFHIFVCCLSYTHGLRFQVTKSVYMNRNKK